MDDVNNNVSREIIPNENNKEKQIIISEVPLQLLLKFPNHE